ncbi:MAG: DUF2818 family protein [Aquabacterium sp.]
MGTGASAWILIVLALLAANLPFVTERVLLLGPRRTPKAMGWRLVELVLLAALVLAIGTWAEARIGRRHVQGWEFYAIGMALFLTFASPGFVWRYLRRGHDSDRG